MAENQNQDKSIFFGVLDAIKRGKKPVVAPETDTKSLITNQPLPTKVGTQQIQQNFLDVQSEKIASDIYARTNFYEADRLTSYMDYKSMDMSPEVSAALDIIADECVSKNEYGDILSIYSENSRVKKVLKDLFYNTLNVNYNLGVWARELVKYGDLFLKLEIDQEEGIYDVRELPVTELHREESVDGKINSARFK